MNKNSPHSASTHAVDKHQGLVDVLGEDGSPQAIGGIVSTFDGFLHRAELQQLLHRTENLGKKIVTSITGTWELKFLYP